MVSFGDVAWRILQCRLFESLRPSFVRLDAYILRGKTSWSEHFSVLILGSRTSVEYFAKFLYTEEPKVEVLGRIALGRVTSYANQLSADLAIVDSSWFFSKFLSKNGFFLSPRLDFVLGITTPLKTILNGVSEGKRRCLKQVAEAGYSFEVTKDPEKLKSFYNDLYLPHMLKRHAACTLPVSFSECCDLFSRGELLLVKSNNELVSGCILVSRGEELWEPILAVKDLGKGSKFTLGSYAIYYFGIIEGKQRGFVKVDFGETPPFMRDGLFQFKKGLGMRVRPAMESSAQVFGLSFFGSAKSITGFLSEYPFVFVDRDGSLSCVVFLEHIDASSIRPFCVSGLSSLYIISATSFNGDFESLTLESIKTEQDSNILKLLACTSLNQSHFVYRVTW